jgi:hypothetical protein
MTSSNDVRNDNIAAVRIENFSCGMTTILTPGYAPWEQYHRHGKQGAWTDVYACAATLYHLVTGTVPPEASERVAEDSLLPPQQLNPALSSQTNHAIMRALSIDPAVRPQSASEFQDALKGAGANKYPQPPPIPSPVWPAPPPMSRDQEPRPAALPTGPGSYWMSPNVPPQPMSQPPSMSQPQPMSQPPYPGMTGAALPPPQPGGKGRRVLLWTAAVLVLLVGGAALSYNSMNGHRTLTHNSGIYEGNVSWGTPSGKGKLTYEDGSVYTGDFARGLRHGKGLLRSKSGDTYDGEWRNDKFDGSGILALTKGLRYEGSFKDGKRNGTGTQVFPDGGQYSGSWSNDKSNGSGVLTTKDGSKYTGPFRDDLPHGEGTLTNARGDQYVGSFEQGQKSGQGTLTYGDGRVYKGHYANDKRNGEGTMKWSTGSTYAGEWKDDKRHGKGTQSLMNSGVIIADYVGEYREDVPFSPNGQYRVVLKKEGRMVIASFRNGSFYW